jgi:hypothetical protein
MAPQAKPEIYLTPHQKALADSVARTGSAWRIYRTIGDFFIERVGAPSLPDLFPEEHVLTQEKPAHIRD